MCQLVHHLQNMSIRLICLEQRQAHHPSRSSRWGCISERPKEKVVASCCHLSLLPSRICARTEGTRCTAEPPPCAVRPSCKAKATGTREPEPRPDEGHRVVVGLQTAPKKRREAVSSYVVGAVATGSPSLLPWCMACIGEQGRLARRHGRSGHTLRMAPSAHRQ